MVMFGCCIGNQAYLFKINFPEQRLFIRVAWLEWFVLPFGVFVFLC